MTQISLLDGGPTPPSRIETLGDALVRAAVMGSPDGLCFIRPDGSELRQPYLRLLLQASRMLTGLRAAGLRPGRPVLLQIGYAPGPGTDARVLHPGRLVPHRGPRPHPGRPPHPDRPSRGPRPPRRPDRPRPRGHALPRPAPGTLGGGRPMIVRRPAGTGR